MHDASVKETVNAPENERIKELYELNNFYNADCMEAMRQFPDGYFELAICDPPYGIKAEGGTGKYGRLKFDGEKGKTWDASIPPPEYFSELFRVSKNQVIFGGNYFPLPPSRGFIIWDKGAGFKGRDFAECEFAWTSFDRNARIFAYDPLAGRDYVGKIHPTQKPVPLYKWILKNYAQDGDKILDTHVGSASSLIACHDYYFDFIGFEIDPDIYARAAARLEAVRSQIRLFDIDDAGGGVLTTIITKQEVKTMTAIIITVIICATLAYICTIGGKKK